MRARPGPSRSRAGTTIITVGHAIRPLATDREVTRTAAPWAMARLCAPHLGRTPSHARVPGSRILAGRPGRTRIRSGSPCPSPDSFDWRLGSSVKTGAAGRRSTLRQDGGGEPPGSAAEGRRRPVRASRVQRHVLRWRVALEPSERRRGGVASRGRAGGGRYRVRRYRRLRCAGLRGRQWPEVSDFVARFCTLQFSHIRVFSDSRNVQKSVTRIIYLGSLPTARPDPSCRRSAAAEPPARRRRRGVQQGCIWGRLLRGTRGWPSRAVKGSLQAMRWPGPFPASALLLDTDAARQGGRGCAGAGRSTERSRGGAGPPPA